MNVPVMVCTPFAVLGPTVTDTDFKFTVHDPADVSFGTGTGARPVVEPSWPTCVQAS